MDFVPPAAAGGSLRRCPPGRGALDGKGHAALEGFAGCCPDLLSALGGAEECFALRRRE